MYIYLGTVNDIDSSVRNNNNSILTNILLFGKASLDISTNKLILNTTDEFMLYLWIMLYWRINLKNFFLVFCRFLLFVDHYVNQFFYKFELVKTSCSLLFWNCHVPNFQKHNTILRSIWAVSKLDSWKPFHLLHIFLTSCSLFPTYIKSL